MNIIVNIHHDFSSRIERSGSPKFHATNKRISDSAVDPIEIDIGVDNLFKISNDATMHNLHT